MMAPLKIMSNKSNSCVISMLVSVDCLLLLDLKSYCLGEVGAPPTALHEASTDTTGGSGLATSGWWGESLPPTWPSLASFWHGSRASHHRLVRVDVQALHSVETVVGGGEDHSFFPTVFGWSREVID